MLVQSGTVWLHSHISTCAHYSISLLQFMNWGCMFFTHCFQVFETQICPVLLEYFTVYSSITCLSCVCTCCMCIQVYIAEYASTLWHSDFQTRPRCVCLCVCTCMDRHLGTIWDFNRISADTRSGDVPSRKTHGCQSTFYLFLNTFI